MFSDVFNDQKFLESNLWNGKKIREQAKKSIKEKNFLNLDNYWKYFNAYLLLKIIEYMNYKILKVFDINYSQIIINFEKKKFFKLRLL